MADLNDFNYTDDVDDVLAVYVNNLLAATLRSEYKNVETLAADKTLTDADTPIQRLDCNGAARIVNVPTADAVENHPFFIVNSSAGAFAITVKSNDGATIIATISQGESALVMPDGNGTYQLVGRERETAYKIAPTVATNDLTLTLTHMDGTTPSTSRPLWFRIGDAWQAVTGALSVTLADGTNWFNSGGANLATQLVGYFAYVGYRTASTAVVLGFSPIPHAKLYSAFSATTTNAKYGAFSTAPASGDDVVNIGYFEATLSAGAGYTWTVPTFTTTNLINRPTFETNWLTSTTTFPAGFTGTPPAWTITYKKMMDVCCMRQVIVSEGTSTATTFTFTVPVAPLESKFNFSPVFVKDNGAQQTVMGHLESTAGSTTIAAFKSWYQGVWTNVNAKNLFFNQIDYRY